MHFHISLRIFTIHCAFSYFILPIRIEHLMNSFGILTIHRRVFFSYFAYWQFIATFSYSRIHTLMFSFHIPYSRPQLSRVSGNSHLFPVRTFLFYYFSLFYLSFPSHSFFSFLLLSTFLSFLLFFSFSLPFPPFSHFSLTTSIEYRTLTYRESKQNPFLSISYSAVV